MDLGPHCGAGWGARPESPPSTPSELSTLGACTPAPGAWSLFEGERIKLGPVTVIDEQVPPGVLDVRKAHVLVGTSTYALRLGEVKPFGKKQMAAADWARGVRLESGVRLGD